MSYYVKAVEDNNNIHYATLNSVDLTHRLKNNLFLLNLRFDFIGNWSLPPYLLILDLKTSIGSFVNIPLKYIGKTNDNIETYEAHIELGLIDIKEFNKISSKKEISIIMNFHINEAVFNMNGFNLFKKEFLNFVNEFINNHYEKTLSFTNFYFIKHLSSKYFKNDVYNKINLLPTDYLFYESQFINSPEYYFDPVYKEQYNRFEAFNHLYNANVLGNLAAHFDKVLIQIDYQIDNEWKQLVFKTDHITNLVLNPVLNLGFKTKYDHSTKTLYFDKQGINGIYIPVPAYVHLTLNLEKNNVIYYDEITTRFQGTLFNPAVIELQAISLKKAIDEI